MVGIIMVVSAGLPAVVVTVALAAATTHRRCVAGHRHWAGVCRT
jgi:hypothetical protein